jgi:Dynamin family
LVNALLGLELLPTGVLPLTAVATEVAYGTRGATVVHCDGISEEVDLGQLAAYVTEAGNPANERQVARFEARVPADVLRSGVVLVDTPGIGSVFRHDEAAARALLEADGAILVLSADAPLSEAEGKLLGALSDRRSPTFFVLNRADHLSQAELDEVTQFVSDALTAALGRKARLWRVSARAALAARLVGEVPDEDDGGEFAAFSRAFERFVQFDGPGPARDRSFRALGGRGGRLARLQRRPQGQQPDNQTQPTPRGPPNRSPCHLGRPVAVSSLILVHLVPPRPVLWSQPSGASAVRAAPLPRR